MLERNHMRMVIITGMSGAGKTQAVRCFEDMGFFCVDNLPPTLIPKFAEICAQSDGRISRIALVIDIRGGKFFDDLLEELATLDRLEVNYRILFLEASDEVLLRRFKEVRRNHPLSRRGLLIEGIKAERTRLRELRGKADQIIDTSDLDPHTFKVRLTETFKDEDDKKNLLTVTVMSFGFKYGLPLDADLVMDVRFLPNPNYEEELKHLTGLDKKVIDYVFGKMPTKIFFRRFYSLLKFMLPYYRRDGRTNVLIAVGCTGGQHRSVVLVDRIGRLLQKQQIKINIFHRELPRYREANNT